jgi:hypothetical protein
MFRPNDLSRIKRFDLIYRVRNTSERVKQWGRSDVFRSLVVDDHRD